MRRLAVVLALALSAPVLAQPQGSDRFVVEDGTNGAATEGSNAFQNNGSTTLVPHTCAANACTRADPSAAAEGLSLTDVSAYRVTVCVSSGTLSGTGTLEAWVYDPDAAASFRWQPMRSKDLTVSASGETCQAFPVERNSMRGNGYRLVYKSNAVATSAAAPTLTVTIRACLKSGAGCGAP